MKTIKEIAFINASEVYSRLNQLFISKNTDINEYLSIVKEYVTLKNKRHNSGTYDMIFSRNNKNYTFYTSLFSFLMFIEDLTMMIYRLYDGDGYNTYSLMDEIRRNKNE